jgi:hypothetical protein
VKRIIATTAGLALTGCVAMQGRPELPPLLQHATAGGGWDSACPPANDEERKLVELAPLRVSPQMQQRLEAAFPEGTHEDLLVAELTSQGFKSGPSCKLDQTIRSASYHHRSSGFLDFADLWATVFWKVDDRRRIVWTKGILIPVSL